MRVAIYSRKSTDDEAAKSVKRQVAHARAYAHRKGWRVLDDHVYVDDGISGAEFKNRPALLRLLNVLKPKPPFEAVVMMEPERLGRDRLRTELVARDLFEAGVRIFYYLDDREERVDTPEQRFVMAARAFSSEMEREKAKQRTRDALLARAVRGHVTGGVVFGYKNIPVYAGTDASGNPIRSHVKLEAEPVEADAVRGIFRMYADGYGLRKIARAMNGDDDLAEERSRYFRSARVSPPRKGSGSWAPSCVNSILKNERYRGKLVWGRFKNTDRGGRTRCREVQPRGSWVTTDVPELRIIDEALWERAQARRHPQPTQGRNYRTVRTGVSASLLSGLSRCAFCDGAIVVSGSSKRHRCYVCSYRRNRGATVCENNLYESVALVDRALLEEIERVVLTPEARRYTLEKMTKLLDTHTQKAPDQREHLKAAWARTKREAVNLLRAIEGGAEAPQMLLERLREKESAVANIEAEMGAITELERFSEIDLRRLKGVLEAQLENVSKALREDLVSARGALQKLLVGRVSFTPVTAEGGDRTYQLEAELTLGRIFPRAVHTFNVPEGIRTPVTGVKGQCPGPG